MSYGDVDVTQPPFSANGSWPGQLADASAAIQAALDSLPKGVIYLPPGTYRLSAPLRVKRTQSLIGAPVGANFQQPSVLKFSPNIAGIIVEDDSTTGGGQETRITDLQVWGLYGNVATVAACGIEAHAGVRLERLRVTGFKGHGISIQGQVPDTRANLWQVRDCQLDTNGGDGLHVEGGDANGGLAECVSATANKGYGIRDDSGLGNTYVSCHTRTNGTYGTDQGGAYRVGAGGPGLSGVNASVLVGCYQEGDQPTSIFGDQVFVVGGTWAGPVRGGQFIVTGQSRLRLQSGGGVTPPLTVMGNRNLTGPVFATSNWAGGVQVAISQDGTLALGLAPGEIVPGQGQAIPPRLSVWTDGVQAAMRFGITKQGYIAATGDIVASADGSGYGAAYTAYRTVGTGGKMTEALRLQMGRCTVGAGGLQLPALSKAERARLKPAPLPGLLAWGVEEGAVVAFDGHGWQALGGPR